MLFRKKEVKEIPNDYMLTISEEGHATLQPCYSDLGMISTQFETYPEDNIRSYPLVGGGKIFITGVTRAAVVKAQEIHDLKHSAVLSGIFSQPEEDIQASGKLYVYPIMFVSIALVIALVITNWGG